MRIMFDQEFFNFPFKTVRDKKIEIKKYKKTFQYNIVHRVIPCNNWLCKIEVKTDDIAHFFQNCPSVNKFWSYWINWWEYLSGIAKKRKRKETRFLWMFLAANESDDQSDD